MRTFWLAVVALVVAGCSDGTGPVGDELDLNVRKWEKRGPSTYSYDYQAICYCIDSVLRPVTISVSDKEIVQVVFRDTQETVAAEAFDGYPNVEDLFEVIRDAIARDAHSIEVGYDPLFGYPTEASIDYQKNIADEEFGFQAWGLTAIE